MPDKAFRNSLPFAVAALYIIWAVRLVSSAPLGWFSAADLANIDYAWTRPFGDIFRGTVFFFGYYTQPLGKLPFYLLYRGFGLNAAPWQFFRLALALAFSAALFSLTLRLSGSRATALLALAVAGLRAQLLLTYSDFSLIPEALAFALFASAFTSHLRNRGTGIRVALFIAAISCHEAALILPLLLIAYEFTAGNRNFRAALPTGAVAAVFLAGKLSGLNITDEPLPRSALSLPNHVIATLTFAGTRITPGLFALVFLGALALALLLRNRFLVWAALAAIATVLPPFVIQGSDNPSLLFPLAAWGIFIAALLTDLCRRIPLVALVPAQTSLVAALFLVAAWPEVKAAKRAFREGPQKEQLSNKNAWDTLAFSAPLPWADKRIGALHHPFKTDSELRRLARLGSRQRVVSIETVSAAPEEYDYVLDYDRRFILIRSGHPPYSAVSRPVCKGVEPLVHRVHDETDSRITWIGSWAHSTEFPSALHGTIAYSNSPAAAVCWNMEGTGFRYTYTKAFNRGTAAVMIDGQPKTEIDLYSSDIQWRSSSRIEGLGPGLHRILIEPTGRKNPLSSDSFIDIDSVEIF